MSIPKITVYNLDDNLFEKLINIAVIEYLNILCPNKFDESYKIDISFHDKIDRGRTQGETKWTDSSKNTKHCTVKVRLTKNKINMLCVIAHEIVHVKQIFSGEFVDVEESETDYLWKGNPHNIYENYYLLPWELEANGYETALFNIFYEKYKLTLHDLQKDNILALKKIANFKEN